MVDRYFGIDIIGDRVPGRSWKVEVLEYKYHRRESSCNREVMGMKVMKYKDQIIEVIEERNLGK